MIELMKSKNQEIPKRWSKRNLILIRNNHKLTSVPKATLYVEIRKRANNLE
jgi:hypothetical protein